MILDIGYREDCSRGAGRAQRPVHGSLFLVRKLNEIADELLKIVENQSNCN